MNSTKASESIIDLLRMERHEEIVSASRKDYTQPKHEQALQGEQKRCCTGIEINHIQSEYAHRSQQSQSNLTQALKMITHLLRMHRHPRMVRVTSHRH